MDDSRVSAVSCAGLRPAFDGRRRPAPNDHSNFRQKKSALTVATEITFKGQREPGAGFELVVLYNVESRANRGISL
jgi:hypothetical protein